MFKNRFPATRAEENFVSNEYVRRPQLVCLHFRYEAVSLREAAH
jgi:hypothetical protein